MKVLNVSRACNLESVKAFFIMEIWKDVPGYEGMYQVSNLGIVKSLARKIRITNGFRYTKDIFLSDKVTNSGYKQVNLNKEGVSKSTYIHRIVAKTFLGDIPKGMVVNHIDCDKFNNNLSNLEIISHRENCIHAHKNGLYKHTNYIRKFREEQVRDIRRKSYYGLSDLEISKHYKCDKSTINRIVRLETYKHIK